MPDGDIIHDRLSGLYWRPYRFLCEEKATEAECSRALQRALKRDLQKLGDSVAHAALVVGDVIESITTGSNVFDPVAANQAVDDVLRSVRCSSAHLEMIRDAARDVTQSIRYGDNVDAGSLGSEVYRRFVLRRAESQFEARLPLSLVHHDGADPVELLGRVRSMAPDLERAASMFARKVASGGSVSEFRVPLQRRQPVSLDENLL